MDSPHLREELPKIPQMREFFGNLTNVADHGCSSSMMSIDPQSRIATSTDVTSI